MKGSVGATALDSPVDPRTIELTIHVVIRAKQIDALGHGMGIYDPFVGDALALIAEEADRPWNPHRSELLFRALEVIARELDPTVSPAKAWATARGFIHTGPKEEAS